MSDYINRQAVIDALEKWKISPIVIAHIPTADVVEPVRCENCKWFVPINNSDHGACGSIGGRTVYPDGFCDEGEEA